MVRHRNEGSTHRHLGLAVTRIAAKQTVHRHRGRHIGFDFGNRTGLVGRLLPREHRFKFGQPRIGEVASKTGNDAATGLCFQKSCGQIFNATLGRFLFVVPPFAIQGVQPHLARVRADVTGE